MENNNQESTKFCKHCGKRIEKEAIVCIHCGKQVEDLNSNGVNVNVNNINGGKLKNKWIAIILALFLGGIGAHKFYEGKTGLGLLYLIFCWTGIPVALSLIDILLLLAKPTEYYI